MPETMLIYFGKKHSLLVTAGTLAAAATGLSLAAVVRRGPS